MALPKSPLSILKLSSACLLNSNTLNELWQIVGFFLDNAGDLGRQDGADSTIWGILAHDLGLLAAAAVVKNFSHITISEHLGQKRSSLNIHSVLEQFGLGKGIFVAQRDYFGYSWSSLVHVLVHL